MVVGSLFAGIGGFDLAARWMGWRTAWFSEIEPYPSSVLHRHWPGVPNHGDITKIRGGEVEPVDILCGGFPCQDISLAGKGAGIDGERSGLWSHYARLIDELRPRWVVAENVSALRSRGLGRVLQDLDALGYDAEWHCVPASAVGAPHRRDRVWIIAYPHGHGHGRARIPSSHRTQDRQQSPGHDSHRLRPDVPDANSFFFLRELQGRCGGPSREEPTVAGQPCTDGGVVQIPDAVRVRLERRIAAGATPGAAVWASRNRRWKAEPDVGRVVDGIRTRVDRAIWRDRLKSLGNALVPQIPFLIFQAIARCEEQGSFVPPVLSSRVNV